MRNPDCPKCGHIMDTFGDDYWCPNCSMKYTKNDVAIKSGEKGNMEKTWQKNVRKIDHLETKFKVLGVFAVIGGLFEFALALVSPLLIISGIISVLLGVFLII